MNEQAVGAVFIIAGCLAAWIGVEAAAHNTRAARRAHRRTVAHAAATLEGWNAWFLGGFADLSTGLRQLASVAAWLAWTLAGACFIGLGTQLMYRW